MRTIVRAVVFILALAAAPAMACPDWRADPHFGQIDLNAGFEPDPWRKRVTAGGTINLERCISGASGFVTRRPDFDLYWDGHSDQLIIAVESNADAVLLVNAPDERWYYDDDSRGSNPVIVFRNPQPGLYDIWIGSYDGSRRNPANLVFTELPY